MDSTENRGSFSNKSEQRISNSLGEKLASEMTVRQKFAAMAMQGFISGLYAGTNAGFTVEGTCFASVEYADALIAELSKEKV